MTTLFAKEGDDLNVLFNTPTEDPLCVYLPENVTFRQKVTVFRGDLIVKGQGNSRIVWGDYHGMVPGFGTGASATLTIHGSNVSLSSLTVENDFDYLEGRRKRSEGIEKGMGLQAVALYITENADQVTVNRCTLLGWQDTLYADGIENIFLECTICGNMDYIFGKAKAAFLSCRIVSCEEGIVAAPSTKESSEVGFVFDNCVLDATENVKEGTVYLARPWHPGARPGVKPAVAFRSCKLGKHIKPEFWTTMLDSKGGVRRPEDARFSLDELTARSLFD